MAQPPCNPVNDNLDPLHQWCGCGTQIGATTSKCLKCGAFCGTKIVRSEDIPAKIYFVRECYACTETPGAPRITSMAVSNDSAYFWQKEKGTECCTNGSCSKPMGTNAITSSHLHTCTMLVELVEGCNMSCPTCYASSPQTAAEHSKPIDFDLFKKNVLARLELQGQIDIIQLSGGEPTLHPQFMEIVAWLAKEERIADILLNTNGIKLNDPEFLRQLALVAPKGRFSVYLQFDGVELDGQVELRAGDFRIIRQRAIEAVTSIGIPVCLTMAVSHTNLPSVWKTIEYSFTNPLIKWVTLQPEFITGRNDMKKLTEAPVSVAHIINSIAKHSAGVMDGKSFMPLPCSHPNCGSIGFLVRVDGAWRPVSDFVDLTPFIGFIKDKMNFDTDNKVEGCGCDNFNLEELMLNFGIQKDDIKMIFIKPFMDIRSWDEERIQSCCTHVMTEDGNVDSFCRHYANKQ